MFKAFAVVYCIDSKNVQIIPDEIYLKEDVAKGIAKKRASLTKIDVGYYDVVPVLIHGTIEGAQMNGIQLVEGEKDLEDEFSDSDNEEVEGEEIEKIIDQTSE